MTATRNHLTDAPPTDPDAPAPLREPKLMSVAELRETHTNYENRLHHDLVWGEDTFTDDERAHAYAVGAAYADWQDVVRWSFRRPD